MHTISVTRDITRDFTKKKLMLATFEKQAVLSDSQVLLAMKKKSTISKMGAAATP